MGRTGARIGAVLLLALATSTASAGVLPLDGAYGNESGCAFFATGEAGEGMILLTPDTYLDGKTGCDLDSAVEEDVGAFAVRGVCATPGEASVKGDILKVQWKDGRATVYDGLEAVGPLLPCVTVVDPGFDA
jgi:hypothetical protein